MGLLCQTTLDRVRLRGGRVGAPVARLRLSHLLASASLRPPAMPPSALLLVRCMGDPLPGRITRAFTPGSLASAEWERAAQERLTAFYSSAMRPKWGPVPSTAAAVLFPDYGELLACLASDLASGTALGWWWKSILRGSLRPLPGSWAAAWENEPLYVPAALHYLEGQQRAVNVLERIAPAQAWNLLMAVLRAFDLSGLMMRHGGNGGERSKPSTPATPLSEVPPENAATGSPTSAAQRPLASPAARVPFPWEPHILRTSTPPELGYERQALLGIGLLLHCVPQVAFHTAFGLRITTPSPPLSRTRCRNASTCWAASWAMSINFVCGWR